MPCLKTDVELLHLSTLLPFQTVAYPPYQPASSVVTLHLVPACHHCRGRPQTRAGRAAHGPVDLLHLGCRWRQLRFWLSVGRCCHTTRVCSCCCTSLLSGGRHSQLLLPSQCVEDHIVASPHLLLEDGHDFGGLSTRSSIVGIIVYCPTYNRRI